jgi:large subunit ribosomal protein L6
MSRIGKYPVPIPQGVEAKVDGQDVSVKGKLGQLSVRVHDDVAVALKDGQIVLEPRGTTPFARQIWPTMRTLVANLVTGVTEGYEKKLELHGVGYRANLQGQDLTFSLGFSHEVRYTVPKEIKVEVEKQTLITLTGIDKQQIGQVAAQIRALKKPEPYKGKGIRYAGEYIARKEGKKK